MAKSDRLYKLDKSGKSNRSESWMSRISCTRQVSWISSISWIIVEFDKFDKSCDPLACYVYCEALRPFPPTLPTYRPTNGNEI